MRAPRVPVEEQYRLIIECRKSGLSDHQWCLNNDINPGTFYNWVKRLRKNGCGDIPEKNQLSTYEQSHQEVVKIEMNSISVPTGMNKNTDTATMELMIGNMNLRISNKTDSLLLAKTIQILTELSCSTADAMEENIKFVKAAVPEALIPNSYASGTAVAWVMYKKFANAMPLYRQEQDGHQLGVDFTSATLAN